jgi:hypothetical protein
LQDTKRPKEMKCAHTELTQSTLLHAAKLENP